MGREGRAAGCAGPHTVGTPAQHVRRSPSLTHTPTQVRGNKPSCLLAQQNRGKLFTVYKPNIGRQSQLETLDSLCRRFHRVGPDGPAVRPHCAPRCARLLQPPGWPSTSVLRCPGRQVQDERAWGLRTSCSPPARWGAWTGRGPGAQPAVSTGDSGGGQRALGEQLHLLADSLQPHHMVRAQGSLGGVGGGVGGGSGGVGWCWGGLAHAHAAAGLSRGPRAGTGTAGWCRRARTARRA